SRGDRWRERVVAAPTHNDSAAQAGDSGRAHFSNARCVSSVRSHLRDDRRWARDFYRTGRALHVQLTPAESRVRIWRGALRGHLPRHLRPRDALHARSRSRPQRTASTMTEGKGGAGHIAARVGLVLLVLFAAFPFY